MAIICLRLQGKGNFASHITGSSIGSPRLSASPSKNFPFQISAEEALRMGDYRDILSLTRVLVHGPESKADVDSIIDRYDIPSYEWKGCLTKDVSLANSIKQK